MTANTPPNPKDYTRRWKKTDPRNLQSAANVSGWFIN